MILKRISLLLLPGLIWARGLIAVVQPELTQDAYRSQIVFQKVLEPYFEQIQVRRGDPKAPCLVVLPEYLGAWLVAVGAPEGVFEAQDINQAMVRTILHYPFKFLYALIRDYLGPFHGPFMGHVQRAIFQFRADLMAEAYWKTFHDLARKYRCWIVAGSIILPEARVRSGRIELLNHNTLYNQSFLFSPVGAVVNVTAKVYPIATELPFLDAGKIENLQVATTELGRVGIMVCADSWHPDVYEALAKRKVDIVAVPSFVTPADAWDALWKGYSPPSNTPPDVDLNDVKSMSFPEAWEKYAVCGRVKRIPAQVGVNSFLLGKFWDLTGAGQSTVTAHKRLIEKSPYSRKRDILYYYMP